ADLLIGAHLADFAGQDSGAAYVVYGGNFSGMPIAAGGAGNDTLLGTSGADSFVAGTGNDWIVGNGGSDSFHAGAGNDRVSVRDSLFFRIDGGTGDDTLALELPDQQLDLTLAAPNRIASIETISLMAPGNQTLTLSLGEVLGLSESTNKITVDGTNGDVVRDATSSGGG